MLQPLQDVLVLELIEESVAPLGIVLPDNYSKEKEEGAVFKVVAVGPGIWDAGVFIKTLLKPGDMVITASYGVSKFTYDGKKVILSRERDIVLKLDGKEAKK